MQSAIIFRFKHTNPDLLFLDRQPPSSSCARSESFWMNPKARAAQSCGPRMVLLSKDAFTNSLQDLNVELDCMHNLLRNSDFFRDYRYFSARSLFSSSRSRASNRIKSLDRNSISSLFYPKKVFAY